MPRNSHREFLLELAAVAMKERGFEPEFSAAAMAEAQASSEMAPELVGDVRDARALPWCSIDNDDSRDLDQLTVAEALDGGGAKLLVAVADVSGTVSAGSELDRHAHVNTTSVYTPPRVFSMLPERLSTDLTSLNAGKDRSAFVVEAVISSDGQVSASTVYRAVVHNHAQLAYSSVGAWLSDDGPLPSAVAKLPALADNIRLQDRLAQSIAAYRREQGALAFAPTEVKAVFEGEAVHDLQCETHDRAHELIENFMIVANGCIANFLADHAFPVIRRVVRSPERWGRIAAIAEHLGTRLPGEPDAKALQVFLSERRAADPLQFPDLSLSIIKLLGRGEYVASYPHDAVTGHFGLAVSAYTHSTAPNRRYPDLITQRLVRAVLDGRPCPIKRDALERLAEHCTEKENDAKRVERQLVKSAAALLLENRVGETFDGIVTGASERGTWVRVFHPPVEGRVEQCARRLDVGDQVQVKLLHTDPRRGFIDFGCVGHRPIGRRRK